MGGVAEAKKSMTKALKELKNIQKKMWKNIKLIRKYSIAIPGAQPLFSSDEEQKEKVQSLIQANIDLFQNAILLKERVDYTNIMTMVEIDGKEYSLHTLLYIKIGLLKEIQDFELEKWPENKPIFGVGNLIYLTHKALSDTAPNQQIDIKRFYDEVKKQESLTSIETLFTMIDEELEDINLKTKLMTIKNR